METGLQLVTIGQDLNLLSVQYAIAKLNAVHKRRNADFFDEGTSSKCITTPLSPINMGKTTSLRFLGGHGDQTFFSQPGFKECQRGHI